MKTLDSIRHPGSFRKTSSDPAAVLCALFLSSWIPNMGATGWKRYVISLETVISIGKQLLAPTGQAGAEPLPLFRSADTLLQLTEDGELDDYIGISLATCYIQKHLTESRTILIVLQKSLPTQETLEEWESSEWRNEVAGTLTAQWLRFDIQLLMLIQQALRSAAGCKNYKDPEIKLGIAVDVVWVHGGLQNAEKVWEFFGTVDETFRAALPDVLDGDLFASGPTPASGEGPFWALNLAAQPGEVAVR